MLAVADSSRVVAESSFVADYTLAVDHIPAVADHILDHMMMVDHMIAD